MDEQETLFHFKPDWKKAMSTRRWNAQKANGSKRVYTRTRFARSCLVCAKEFQVNHYETLRGAKYCSRSCANKARAIGKPPRVCMVCGGVIAWSENPDLYRYRKTCSVRCSQERAKRAKEGKKNPNYKSGEARRRREWHLTKAPFCMKCGTATSTLHLHHVVYEQQVRRTGGDIYDTRNSLTLCIECHHGHHGAADRRLHISLLDEQHLEFASELLLARSFDYLVRRYDGTFQEFARRLRPYLERLGVADSIARYFPPEPAELEW